MENKCWLATDVQWYYIHLFATDLYQTSTYNLQRVCNRDFFFFLSICNIFVMAIYLTICDGFAMNFQ